MINSIDRALKILDVLYSSEQEIGVSEIALKLGIYKSTVSRTLSTLKANGYVYQNLTNDKFGLGMRLYGLGTAVVDRFTPIFNNLCDILAQELLVQYPEVFNYCILDIHSEPPRQLLLYKKQTSQNILTFSPRIGSYSPAYCSGTGKVLLANCGEDYLKRIYGCKLMRFTKNTICEWDALLDELECIRKQGYAIDDEEQEVGLYCVSVLVGNKEGAASAISLSGPTLRMKNYDIDEMVIRLKVVAQKVAQHLYPFL